MKLILLICLGFLAFYIYNNSTENYVYESADGAPPSVYKDPVQKNISGKSKPFQRGVLNLLAGYEVTARILDIGRYRHGKEASIAPMDLTLGWKKMSEEAVFKRLNVRNTHRWYKYNWRGAPPIPPREIVRSSANVHVIPANGSVRDALATLHKYQFVTLKGYLVHYREGTSKKWWEWKSSLSRTDKGDGSCELMYVERVLPH